MTVSSENDNGITKSIEERIDQAFLYYKAREVKLHRPYRLSFISAFICHLPGPNWEPSDSMPFSLAACYMQTSGVNFETG